MPSDLVLSIQSAALFPSARDLPYFLLQSLTDKQLVPVSEKSLSSVADDATEAQSPPTPAVYCAAPPQYPPIAGARARENGITHNLMSHFVDMSNPGGFGVIMNVGELLAWIISRS